MKQGIVKFSKEFVTPIGLKEWVGIEYPFDLSNSEDPKLALTQAKEIVEQWHSSNCQGILASSMPPCPPAELPVINKEHERLEMLIDNSKSIEELMGYKNNLSSPFLANCFWTKHQQLVLQPNK